MAETDTDPETVMAEADKLKSCGFNAVMFWCIHCRQTLPADMMLNFKWDHPLQRATWKCGHCGVTLVMEVPVDATDEDWAEEGDCQHSLPHLRLL